MRVEITEELYDNKFPVTRGPAYLITDYMKLPKDQLEPIMTNSENIVQFGPSFITNLLQKLELLSNKPRGSDREMCSPCGRNVITASFRLVFSSTGNME